MDEKKNEEKSPWPSVIWPLYFLFLFFFEREKTIIQRLCHQMETTMPSNKQKVHTCSVSGAFNSNENKEKPSKKNRNFPHGNTRKKVNEFKL